MLASGAATAGSAVGQLFMLSFSLFSFALDAALLLFSFVIELGGYALTAGSLVFTLFTGCFVHVFTEVLRPATEWHSSEAKRAGPWVACCSCVCVLSCILLFTVLIAFWATTSWYELELLGGNEALEAQLARSRRLQIGERMDGER